MIRTRWAASLAFLVVAGLLWVTAAPRSASGQAGGAAHRFVGTFRIAGQPAAAGTEIKAIVAQSATDVVVCGTTTVSDGGNFTLSIPPIARCADQGNAGGPVRFIFTWTGESVGGVSIHIDLNRPSSLGQTSRASLAAPSNPARPGEGPDIVLRRIYGFMRLDGQPVPPGTEVRTVSARSVTDVTECGRTATVEGGAFSLDLVTEFACTDEGNAGGPVQLRFFSGEQQVGGISARLSYTTPRGLGDSIQVSLSGRREVAVADAGRTPTPTAMTSPPSPRQPAPPVATGGSGRLPVFDCATLVVAAPEADVTAALTQLFCSFAGPPAAPRISPRPTPSPSPTPTPTPAAPRLPPEPPNCDPFSTQPWFRVLGSRPTVYMPNSPLQNRVTALFQATDTYPGGTAGILRIENGDRAGPLRWHTIKARNEFRAIRELLTSGALTDPRDRCTAYQLLADLLDALGNVAFLVDP